MSKFSCRCGNLLRFRTGRETYDGELLEFHEIQAIAHELITVSAQDPIDYWLDRKRETSIGSMHCEQCDRYFFNALGLRNRYATFLPEADTADFGQPESSAEAMTMDERLLCAVQSAVYCGNVDLNVRAVSLCQDSTKVQIRYFFGDEPNKEALEKMRLAAGMVQLRFPRLEVSSVYQSLKPGQVASLPEGDSWVLLKAPLEAT